MTCIVAIAERGKVWMGGDSLGQRNGTKLFLAEGKIAQSGEFLIGACGTVRHVNLIRHVFQPPALAADADLDGYMSASFLPAWRDCLKENGALQKGEGDEDESGGMLLIGVRGQLYEIDYGFGVARPVENYRAVGSGDNIALGVLHATAGLPAEKRIRLALSAAEKWDGGVAAPFHVKSVGKSAPSKADAHMMKAWGLMHTGKRQAAKKGGAKKR